MANSLYRTLIRRLRSTSAPRDGRQSVKDELLARRLARTFEHDLALADVHGIHFYVREGTVTLYGVVQHDLDRELLVGIVRDVEGVEDVVDNLQVVAPHFRPDAVPAEVQEAPSTPDAS